MKKISLLFLAIIIIFSTIIKPATAATKTIMAFGDSLTAGTGLSRSQAFPAVLERALQAKRHDVTVINSGVGGETTSGGLTRMAFTLQQNPDYVILELGANDMLRSLPIENTEKNLRAMLDILKERNIPVLLCGMRTFRNFNLFGDSFQKIYKRIAKDYDVLYYPFFLEGVAMDAKLNQMDGLHPNTAGVAIIVENIMPYVEELLEQ